MTINISQIIRYKKNFEQIKSAKKFFILNVILLYISRNLYKKNFFWLLFEFFNRKQYK